MAINLNYQKYLIICGWGVEYSTYEGPCLTRMSTCFGFKQTNLTITDINKLSSSVFLISASVK